MPKRTSFTVDLRPLAGSRFQPTGFPGLGAAVFPRPDGNGGWVDGLHVESPQSMANRLELTTWEPAEQAQAPGLAGLPYIEVVNSDGEFLTSSRLEAHRLASAYIMTGETADGVKGEAWLQGLFGLAKGKPLDYRRVAAEVFALDPVSLIHGVFFARKAWPWQPKIARALTCFIDADNVRPAVSGGVKTDSVDPRVSEGAGTKEGFGTVPHSRVEYTAQSITAYVTLDHEQIRSYGLSDERTAVLEALAQYELSTLFGGGGLRLRTACDLDVVEVRGFELASPHAAAQALRAAIDACGDLGEVQTMTWAAGKA